MHGGVDFAQALKGPLERRGARTEIPLPGGWAEDAPLHEEDEHEPPVRAVLELPVRRGRVRQGRSARPRAVADRVARR